MLDQEMIYFHVPFCQSRCIYCDFYSTVNGTEMREAYVRAACRELDVRAQEWQGNSIASVYFGGGTPSLLTAGQVGRMLERVAALFPLASDAEITIEGNPDDITSELPHDWREVGINRASLGVQSLHDETLRLLGRRHSAAQAVRAVNRLVDVGLDNVSIDLMYGLPTQTLEQWGEDLRQALSLPVKHLSAYALGIEPGTVLGSKVNSGELNPVSETLYLSEFEMMMDESLKKGFKHYEISNFALPGYCSRHNSGYWKGLPYLGIGPGACSFDGLRTRRTNKPDLAAYVQSDGHPNCEIERLSLAECFNECVFTALRTSDGLSLPDLAERFPEEWRSELLEAAQRSVSAGHLKLDGDDVLRLTRSGLFVSNDVMSDLMRV